MSKTIIAECPACGGTGLYKGFMERDDEAVVCVRCSGSGAKEIRYEEFIGRKKKNGVKKIRTGSGSIIDSPGPSSWVSYEEFERKIPAGRQ